MTVRVYATMGGTGVCCASRPGQIGRYLPPSDLDDTWITAAFTTQLGAVAGIAIDGFYVQNGDVLEFDIMIPPPETGSVGAAPASQSPSGYPTVGGIGPGGTGNWTDDTSRTSCSMGLDLKFLGGPWLSDLGIVDMNSGINIAYGDKLPVADSVWYHMRADLSPFAGLTLDRQVMTCDEDGTFRYVVLFKNIFITRAGAIVKTIFAGYQNPYKPSIVNFNDGLHGGWFVDSGLIGDLQVFGEVVAEDLSGPYNSPTVTVSTGTAYTVPITIGTVLCNSGTGNLTVTLYLAGTVPLGRRLTVINLHATNTVTVEADGIDVIDGGTTVGPFNQYEGVTLESNGVSAFHVVP